MNNLMVYTTGSEYVIADSPADAVAVWNATIGDDWIADNYGTIDDWKPCNGGDEFRICMVDEDIETLTGAMQPGYKDIVMGKHHPVVIADFNYWISVCGRSYLAGEDV